MVADAIHIKILSLNAHLGHHAGNIVINQIIIADNGIEDENVIMESTLHSQTGVWCISDNINIIYFSVSTSHWYVDLMVSRTSDYGDAVRVKNGFTIIFLFIT